MKTTPIAIAALSLAATLAVAAPAKQAKHKPTAAEAKAFVTKVNDELKNLWVRQSNADWIRNTYITDDTEQASTWANEATMAYLANAIKEAAQFDGVKVDAETGRMLYLLKVASTVPAPSDAKQREELASISAKLEGLYGKAKYCGKDGKGKCREILELTETMAKSRNYDELLDAWTGWHSTAVASKPLYERMVEISNEGAKEIGYKNVGDLWRSGYDMSPADFEKETNRLWDQLRPLYDQLHCYVRARLSKFYGADKVALDKPIPAHLLGNLWAQEWQNVYSLVEPYKVSTALDVDAGLKAQNYDPKKLVKLGESFFTSLGLDPLPATFWERSQFTKPQDREVVCHASAWDVTYNNDLRIKMCIKVNEEDLITVHHELGHDYYFHQYYMLPALYQQGANDGFHEAIGDTMALSVTPAYLKNLGLIQAVPTDEKGLINVQLKDALDKVAFLPFGLLIDQWRWDVFSGKIKPANYNAAWWALRKKYQGVDTPVARSESDFDPGAKYHIPANVPYTRYFLARILQFQFHRALCKTAGHTGPLHTCSIYGNKDAGAKLKAMLALGASKPWPEALYAMTGERQMDAGAMADYFAPLYTWLKEQNKGMTCGW